MTPSSGVGGLMVQARQIAHDIAVTGPTADLDVLLHIDVESIVVSDAHEALITPGYEVPQAQESRRARRRSAS